MNNNGDELTAKLTLEQQFQLQVIEQDIEKLDLEQAKEYLREAFRQLMLKENLCKEMFKRCYLKILN